MRAPSPLFYLYLFVNATVLLPVALTGLRVYLLWYSPLADTGRATFLQPYVEFLASCLLASLATGVYVARRPFTAFYPPQNLTAASVLKSMVKRRVGKLVLAFYAPLYFASFMVVSGMLLIPGINVAPAFVRLTEIAYQGAGAPMIGPFAVNIEMLVIGVVNLVVLSAAAILGFYVVSLIHTSQTLVDKEVKGSLRTPALQGVGGFLAASAPAVGTTAVICCLTPTGVNSLLYLLSASVPIIGKKILWSYGAVSGLFLVTGLLQGADLLSTSILGFIMLGLSVYQIRKIGEAVKGNLTIENKVTEKTGVRRSSRV
ncbi:MAG: hypothetical protein QXI37_03995 [Thermoprotei archaeon]